MEMVQLGNGAWVPARVLAWVFHVESRGWQFLVTDDEAKEGVRLLQGAALPEVDQRFFLEHGWPIRDVVLALATPGRVM